MTMEPRKSFISHILQCQEHDRISHLCFMLHGHHLVGKYCRAKSFGSCRYEGLTQVNVPHNKGIMVFGSGTGAGIQSVKPFDK